MHVLAASQGIAVMSNAYSDREFVRREARQLIEIEPGAVDHRLAFVMP
jgi:hypothetical protein